MQKSLTPRFVILSVVVAVFMVAMTVEGFNISREYGHILQQSNTVSSALKNHLESDMMHDGIRGDVLGAILAAKKGSQEDINTAKTDLEEHIGVFRENVEKNSKLDLPSDLKAALEKLTPDFAAYSEEAMKLIENAKQSADAADAEFPVFMEKFSALEESMGSMSDKLEGFSKQQEEEVAAKKQFILFTLIALSIAGLVSVAVNPIIVIRQVFRPMKKMSVEMEKLSNNDISIQIPQGKGEIAQMGTALKGLKDAVAENLLLQKMTSGYPVIRCDREYKVTYINAAADGVLSKLGQSSSQLLNQNISAFSEDVYNKREEFARNASGKKELVKIANEWVDLEVTSIRDEVGNSDGFYFNLNIVTDVMRTQEAINALISQVADNGNLKERIDATKFSGFYRDLATSMNGLLDNIVQPVDNAINVLTGLSEGHLDKTMEGNYKGSFAEVQRTLNDTICRLRQMVGQIIESARSVHTAAQEIAQGNGDLTKRTEEQAASIEETTASMEGLTQSVRDNSNTALEANKLSSKASNVASQGEQSVKQVVEAMNLINGSSKKIADIIDVIDEIAFQTNLLALNAAVEAARAGDAGKGFAVVASEVRALAGRSADASKQINQLITTSVEQVQQGSKLVDSAGKTLEEIIASFSEVTSLISNIATSSQDQASGIDQINVAVKRMDEGTQQNAAMVEESTAAAQSMVDQSNALEKLVSFFKLDGNSNVRSANDYVSHAPSGIKKAPTPAKQANVFVNKPSFQPQPKKVASGNASYSSGGGGASSEGWEEF
jgi:methyl-accepting chemotaxis protein